MSSTELPPTFKQLRDLRTPENDGLNWPHCDGLNWPHLRPTGGRLFDAHRARAEGARGNGIQGGAVRADQTGS